MKEIRALSGHVSYIRDISWSRHSRYVLTASKDWNCIVWDLASELEPPQRARTIRFDYEVARAAFHPRNRYHVHVFDLENITAEAFSVTSLSLCLHPGMPILLMNVRTTHLALNY